MSTVEQLQNLEDRNCPVCGAASDEATLYLKRSFDPALLDEFSYASRKTPEYMSFELVTCPHCATVYASSAPPAGAIAAAYHDAGYDSADEATLAAKTYADALAPFLARLPSKTYALEIGTGTGVFLTKLKALGFQRVVGVEPSRKAIEAADPGIRPDIREGIFKEGDFEPQSFDLICCFMTLEHVPDPRQLVEAAARLLRPGGLLALVTHDYKAAVNRVLGRRSPIIDIEHLQIFCPESLARLIALCGLDKVSIESFANRYRMQYWLRLAPVPKPLKSGLNSALRATGFDNTTLRVNVGNLLTVARKPVLEPGCNV